MAAWASRALPLVLVAALLAFEDWFSTPSCPGGAVRGGGGGGGGDLKAMMVADLMLLGSDASYTDIFFRVPLMSKLFSKSIRMLKPDMIIVLGDISAKGSELTESKWIAVLEQFERMLGPSARLPLHVALGDRDVGECAKLDGKFVRQMASHLPGLDSSGCSAFEIGNVSFVSLNAVAMLCGNNALRFSIEKVMERESRHFQKKMKNEFKKFALCSENREGLVDFRWRKNNMASGSGPVVLLHFPLHKSDEGKNGVNMFSEGTASHLSFIGPKSKHRINLRNPYNWCNYHIVTSCLGPCSGAAGMRPYDLVHTLPANATEYILQALKPRIVFNAHAHSFSDLIHADGTREVTVPAMTWTTRGKPGFVIVTFGRKGGVTVRHCSLAQEWHVIIGYMAFLLPTALAVRWSHWM